MHAERLYDDKDCSTNEGMQIRIKPKDYDLFPIIIYDDDNN